MVGFCIVNKIKNLKLLLFYDSAYTFIEKTILLLLFNWCFDTYGLRYLKWFVILNNCYNLYVIYLLSFSF